MSTTSIASNVVNEQADLLATALSVVKVQAFHMKRCLVSEMRPAILADTR